MAHDRRGYSLVADGFWVRRWDYDFKAGTLVEDDGVEVVDGPTLHPLVCL